MDSKLMKLQSICLDKGEAIIECSNRILDLVSKLECATHSASKIEKKRALLRGLPPDFDVTAETILNSVCDFHEFVSKFIVRETRLWQTAEDEASVLVAHGSGDEMKCFTRSKAGHISHDFWKNKRGRAGFRDKQGGNETCKCF